MFMGRGFSEGCVVSRRVRPGQRREGEGKSRARFAGARNESEGRESRLVPEGALSLFLSTSFHRLDGNKTNTAYDGPSLS